MSDLLWLVEDYSAGPYHFSKPRAVFSTEAEARAFVEDNEPSELAVNAVVDRTNADGVVYDLEASR